MDTYIIVKIYELMWTYFDGNRNLLYARWYDERIIYTLIKA